MNTIPIFNPVDWVLVAGDQLVTTSRKVAVAFNKRHRDVLRAVRILIADLPEEDRERNFALCYENNSLQNGKRQPLYQISKNGLMLLVMGFTGPRALSIKLAYMKAFDAMAEMLRRLSFDAWHQYDIANLRFERDKAEVSTCARYMRRWQDLKPEHLRRLEQLHPQLPLLN